MSGDSSEPVLKRKRTTTACDSCRTRKSKCDGQKPICGRCSGYGHSCSWSGEILSHESHLTLHGTPQEMFLKYQEHVLAICSQDTGEPSAEVLKSLEYLRSQVCLVLSCEADECSPRSDKVLVTLPKRGLQNYLGEISDIHFLSVVDRTVETGSTVQGQLENMDTYDHDEAMAMQHDRNTLLDLPEKNDTDEFMEAYFSTIHIAYPFITETSLRETLELVQKNRVDPKSDLRCSWFSLLYAVLAIGAYYTSFRGDRRRLEVLHQKLFRRSLALSQYDILEKSLTQCSAILTQCFYLLAVSKIDRCWASLGLAIRLGQSIGLHASDKSSSSRSQVTYLEEESSCGRSTLWYSLYVLDRLTALQLGRPPAIADTDCRISIPKCIEDLESRRGTGNHGQADGQLPRVSEYLVRMVSLSSIIGRILRDTYHPHRTLCEKLQITRDCDSLVLTWKEELPSYLAFDVGHIFEKSTTFKRQRNMLAIKYHHLRTLIYRPHMCHSHVEPYSDTPDTSGQVRKVQQYQQTCIAEARATIHLMYNVTDVSELVSDYPWWQMVSCLVCAGSVLVMAEALVKLHQSTESSLGGVERDLSTCLKILDALSANSHGAKLACGMLKKVRRKCTRLPSSKQAKSKTPEENGVNSTQQAYWPATVGESATAIESEVGDGKLEEIDVGRMMEPDLDWFWQTSASGTLSWPENFFELMSESPGSSYSSVGLAGLHHE